MVKASEEACERDQTKKTDQDVMTASKSACWLLKRAMCAEAVTDSTDMKIEIFIKLGNEKKEIFRQAAPALRYVLHKRGSVIPEIFIFLNKYQMPSIPQSLFMLKSAEKCKKGRGMGNNRVQWE